MPRKPRSKKKEASKWAKAVAETTGIEAEDLPGEVYAAYTDALPTGQRGLAALKENSWTGNVMAATEAYGHVHHGYDMVTKGLKLAKGVLGR